MVLMVALAFATYDIFQRHADVVRQTRYECIHLVYVKALCYAGAGSVPRAGCVKYWRCFGVQRCSPKGYVTKARNTIPLDFFFFANIDVHHLFFCY